MQRRRFIQNATAAAVGVGVFGSLRFTQGSFVGDTATTSDILGPFYRPGAPFRTNLNPTDYDGDVLHLLGTVFKHDGRTPAAGCGIEIWQCRPDGFYDNVSGDYAYRGSAKTGADGGYHFVTAQPPPEPTDETKTVYRPAHIHLRISSEGGQDLITQVYFQGDGLLPGDPSTKSPLAFNRILLLKRRNEKESEVRFDVVLRRESVADENVLRQVCGVYRMTDGSHMEFYSDGDLLFYKINGQIWGALSYAGDYCFSGMNTEARFAVEEGGSAGVSYQFLRRREIRLEGKKVLAYGGNG